MQARGRLRSPSARPRLAIASGMTPDCSPPTGTLPGLYGRSPFNGRLAIFDHPTSGTIGNPSGPRPAPLIGGRRPDLNPGPGGLDPGKRSRRRRAPGRPFGPNSPAPGPQAATSARFRGPGLNRRSRLPWQIAAIVSRPNPACAIRRRPGAGRGGGRRADPPASRPVEIGAKREHRRPGQFRSCAPDGRSHGPAPPPPAARHRGSERRSRKIQPHHPAAGADIAQIADRSGCVNKGQIAWALEWSRPGSPSAPTSSKPRIRHVAGIDDHGPGPAAPHQPLPARVSRGR